MAANAGDLAVMLQDLDAAPYRQGFGRPPGVEATAFHAWPADAEEAGAGQAFHEGVHQMARQQIPEASPATMAMRTSPRPSSNDAAL